VPRERPLAGWGPESVHYVHAQRRRGSAATVPRVSSDHSSKVAKRLLNDKPTSEWRRHTVKAGDLGWRSRGAAANLRQSPRVQNSGGTSAIGSNSPPPAAASHEGSAEPARSTHARETRAMSAVHPQAGVRRSTAPRGRLVHPRRRSAAQCHLRASTRRRCHTTRGRARAWPRPLRRARFPPLPV